MMATDRSAEERAFAQEASRNLPADQRQLWDEMRAAHRVPVYDGRILVLWKLLPDGQPQPVGSLRVAEVKMSFSRGVEIGMLDAQQRLVVVGQQPMKIPGFDLFMWAPYYNDVQWVPHPSDSQRSVLRMALVMRTRSHPDHLQPGHVYVDDVGAFRRRFPQFTGQKF